MSVADMKTIETQVDELVETFRDLMIQVFDKEPEIFEGRGSMKRNSTRSFRIFRSRSGR